MNVNEMILQDADDSASNTKVVLRRVALMCAAARDAERRLAEAEKKLKEEKAALDTILREDLPLLLNEAGLKDITLEDGTKVKINPDISCAITQARKPEAHEWLRNHDGGGIIKTQVAVSFGKGELDRAESLVIELVDSYGESAVSMDEGVHYQTLKSWLKERIAKSAKAVEEAIERGEDPSNVASIPFDLFSIEPFDIAKITLPKAK